ncbi:hypothetical protein WMY93_018376 [Mugilogobius chulae]|uniref:Ig-like domain-containing protein n=1 Tax=Mugilogobius chulae TaxID=88201 RepID=A0AAW0NU20_9GOBI
MNEDTTLSSDQTQRPRLQIIHCEICPSEPQSTTTHIRIQSCFQAEDQPFSLCVSARIRGACAERRAANLTAPKPVITRVLCLFSPQLRRRKQLFNYRGPGQGATVAHAQALWKDKQTAAAGGRSKRDLSRNRIGCLVPEVFLDLGSLSKLNLSGNIFSTLSVGLFTHLLALKVIHFQTESLFCDCQLQWLLLWVKSNSVRIGNDTTCAFPTHLHGLEFRELRESQLRCDGPLELPLFQLIPSQRQLVFQGDRLPLQCTASYLHPHMELLWRHNGQPVSTQEERGVSVEESLIHDCSLITSEVVLSNMDVSLAGTWECLVSSLRGNSSKQMEIVVLETSAPYCPADRVTNNKGDFRWPKTLAGILAFLPCAPATFGSAPHPSGHAPHSSHSKGERKEKKAWRRCDRLGRWAEEDYTQCPYASELTRVLHQLTQISVNTSNAQPLGKQLVAFTSRAAHFTDVMDVIFVTHLVERLTRLLGKRRDLGTISRTLPVT